MGKWKCEQAACEESKHILHASKYSEDHTLKTCPKCSCDAGQFVYLPYPGSFGQGKGSFLRDGTDTQSWCYACRFKRYQERKEAVYQKQLIEEEKRQASLEGWRSINYRPLEAAHRASRKPVKNYSQYFRYEVGDAVRHTEHGVGYVVHADESGANICFLDEEIRLPHKGAA